MIGNTAGWLVIVTCLCLIPQLSKSYPSDGHESLVGGNEGYSWLVGGYGMDETPTTYASSAGAGNSAAAGNIMPGSATGYAGAGNSAAAGSTMPGSAGGGTDSCEGTCQYSEWTPWSSPGIECGTSEVSRTRKCTIVQDKSEKKTVDLGPCCLWTPWGAWSSSSQTCGATTSQKTRVCTDGGTPAGKDCGLDKCDGDGQDTKQVTLESCCSWTMWGEWSKSSATCGVVETERNRLCAEEGGQKECLVEKCGGGLVRDTRSEDRGPCCSWSQWGMWSTPSETCGNATVKRRKTCEGDEQCQVENCGGGSDEETKNVDLGPCCSWSDWGSWALSATCDPGTKTRTRTCSGGSANAYACTCPGDGSETTDIENPEKCPDGGGGMTTTATYTSTTTTTMSTESKSTKAMWMKRK